MQTWAGAGIIGLKRTNRGQRTLRDSRGKRDADGARADIAARLGTTCNLSRAKTGHGFGQYKEKTLVRRIQRQRSAGGEPWLRLRWASAAVRRCRNPDAMVSATA